MKTPEVVPEKFDSPIDYKILFLIIFSSIVFQFLLNVLFPSDDRDFIVSIVSVINPLAASLAGFLVTLRYRGSLVFGKSYLMLSLGFFCAFLGELTYLIYDLVLNIEPYPSIADVFFFAYSPFLIAHLIINIRFFQPTTKLVTKVWVSIIPIGIVFAYIWFSLHEIGEVNFDFYYGTIFVAATSVALTLTILGTRIFKEGILGKSWLILLFGILSLTIADDVYYYLEIPGNYDLTHPINILWYAGYWIVFYALLKHKESI